MKNKILAIILTTIMSIGTFTVASTENVQAATCSTPVNDASNLIVNGSFERPIVGNSGQNFYDQSLVPGWQTTNANGIIELWGASQRCNIGGGVPAVDGYQICEVNAKGPSDVFQDINLCPGDQVYWSIYHRATLGTDTMDILIGAPGKETVQKTVTTSRDWRIYSGYYTVPAGQTTTRIIFRSVSSFLNKTANGNLIDCAYMKLVKKGVCPVTKSLSGVVTDKNTGLPIPNATVTITDKDGKTYTVITDGTGHYKFDNIPTGQYEITATSDGYIGFTGNITVNDNKTQNIELEQDLPTPTSVSVTGVVTDKETGLPIPNATVVITDDNGHTFTATTNASGEYTINNVPAGDYTTKVTADGYNPETGSINVDQDTTYNPQLDRTTATVSGKVTDKGTGLPISNAIVVITDKNGKTFTATTDATGSYTINKVPTGDYDTKVTADGYNPETGSINVKDNTTYNAKLDQTTVTVSGKVTDKSTDLPIPNATVVITGKDGKSFTVTTDATGYYTINNVPTGDYTTKVTAKGYDDLTGNINVKDNTTYNAQLNRTIVTVTGVVTDKNTGLPIPNATVIITDKDGKSFTATTDPTGAYTINNVPTGDYATKVTANGYNDLSGTISVNDNTTYNAQLNSSIATVTGVITDKNTGLPISNATVIITDKDGKSFTATTDPTGAYTINNVPKGEYSTKVTANGYNEVTGSISVNDNTTYNAELNRTIVTVTGVITDKTTSLPISNATVIITDKDGKSFTATTDATGSYTINNVPTGDYSTKVSATGYNEITGSISVNDNTTYNAQLDRSIVSITGIVTDKNTKLPISNATVTVTGNGKTYTATTDATGAYTINNVPTGDYTTKVTANGYDDLSGSINVKDNTTYNAELNRTMVVVSGVITDKNTGLAISSATVTITGNGKTYTATTNSSGAYTINNVPTGDYTTNVTAAGYNEISGSVSVQSNTTYNAELERKIVSITGVVTDKNTKLPILGATVSITANGQTFTATTDASGAYTISNIQTGNYTTKVTATGYTDLTGSLNVVDNTTYNAELNRKIVTITGVVTDKNTNAPISNATVVLNDKEGHTYTGTTNNYGAYTINNVLTGEYTTKVTANGYAEVDGTLTVIDNTTYNAQLIKLVTVSGTVTNKYSGNPISGVKVTIESNGKTYTATTNSSGFYSISDVEMGQYSIIATASKYGDYTNTINVTSDTTHNIQLTYNLIN